MKFKLYFLPKPLALQTRDAVETTAALLRAKGIECAMYHAGLTPEARSRAHRDFVTDAVDVIAATVAFGMGWFYIFKPLGKLVFIAYRLSLKVSTNPMCVASSIWTRRKMWNRTIKKLVVPAVMVCRVSATAFILQKD